MFRQINQQNKNKKQNQFPHNEYGGGDDKKKFVARIVEIQKTKTLKEIKLDYMIIMTTNRQQQQQTE